MPNIDLKRLRAFQMIERHAGLRGAAATLRLTTSAVSIQLKQLEEELGVVLFDRANKKFTLTETGAEFLKDVDRILADVDQAITSLADAKKPRTRIALGIGFDLTGYFAAQLAYFMKQHELVDLSLRLRPTRDILRYMLDGEIDLGVGHFEDLPRQIVRQPLVNSGFFALCLATHPFAKLRNPGVPDLDGQVIVLPRQDNHMGRQILRSFDEHEARPANLIEAGSCQSSYNLAKEGIGVAIIHTTCLGTQHTKALRIFDMTKHFGQSQIVVAYPKSLRLKRSHEELICALEAARPCIKGR
jgi:DNA-binding transcriptional LysR family regulator